MPDWKRTNFEVLEDRSPVDAPMRWLFARAALESPELGVSRFVYEPGALDGELHPTVADLQDQPRCSLRICRC